MLFTGQAFFYVLVVASVGRYLSNRVRRSVAETCPEREWLPMPRTVAAPPWVYLRSSLLSIVRRQPPHVSRCSTYGVIEVSSYGRWGAVYRESSVQCTSGSRQSPHDLSALHASISAPPCHSPCVVSCSSIVGYVCLPRTVAACLLCVVRYPPRTVAALVVRGYGGIVLRTL